METPSKTTSRDCLARAILRFLDFGETLLDQQTDLTKSSPVQLDDEFAQVLAEQHESIQKALAAHVETSLQQGGNAKQAVMQQRWVSIYEQCEDAIKEMTDKIVATGLTAETMCSTFALLPSLRSSVESILRQESFESAVSLAELSLGLNPYYDGRHAVPPTIIAGEKYQWDSHVLRNVYGSILRWLRFPLMNEGKRNLSTPEPGTCDWFIGTGKKRTPDSTGILCWASHAGTRPFVITGPPGSGKSTIMKFISQSLEFTESVRQWKVSATPCIASHFFWRAGLTMTTSVAGLLRCVLVFILRQHPWLIQYVFPTEFKLTFDRQVVKSTSRHQKLGHPSMSQLFKAFKVLAEQEQTPLKIVLLIDGLDMSEEFENLLKLLKYVSTANNIKIVLAARPTYFVEATLPSSCNIHITDLNREGMRGFVRTKLQTLEETYNIELVDFVTEASQGMFLWARVAINRLQSLAKDGADANELSEAIREMPTSMNDVYKGMSKERSASMVRMVQTHQISQLRSFNAAGNWKLSLFDLYLACHPESQGSGSNIISALAYTREQMSRAGFFMEHELKNLCFGLITVNDDQPYGDQSLDLTEARVGFEHGTSWDFAADEFKPSPETCQHLIRTVMRRLAIAIAGGSCSRPMLWDFAIRALKYASFLESLGSIDKEYERVLTFIDRNLQYAHELSLQERGGQWVEKIYMLGNMTRGDKGREAKYHASRH
ncbi:hypothetical protein PG994_013971 [Apiospora phragmitis]|uniref:Nephrocystin 3-like N-terminal domain-containing protein n=1 Tax=Apiospora phragmitis TaxID=2905665 RepID=A0ABR1T315_9PEZI